MSTSTPYSAVLIEPTDALFWRSFENVQLPKYEFKSILCSGATAEYQCGRTTRLQYISRLVEDFDHPLEDIDAALLAYEESTVINTGLMRRLSEIKAEYGHQVSFYAVANLSREDFDLVGERGMDWSLFEQVFISSQLEMRKPELRFFKHILTAIGRSAAETTLIDGVIDNTLAALSLGFRNIYRLEDHLSSQLVAIFGLGPSDKEKSPPRRDSPQCHYERHGSPQLETDALVEAATRGRRFLEQNAGNFPSVTATGVEFKENFAQLLMLELLHDRTLVKLEDRGATWNYFIGEPVLTQASFPDDIDTTSLGTTILGKSYDEANLIMDLMLKYLSPDGILQTFFTDVKNRVDPVVCCNALSLFYQYGRGNELSTTLHFVIAVLHRRAYLYGTSFYPVPETFLYCVRRLLPRIERYEPKIHDDMKESLIERMEERRGVAVDPASLAMRLTICHQLDLRDIDGLHELVGMQEPDGGWGMGVLYRYASKNLDIGNRGLTTALATYAIDRCQLWVEDH